MPKRTDLRSILIVGSGPIVIGQACEFDYSGTQACRALRREGYRVDPGQLEPGDDHDRPGVLRRHLRRAAGAGGGRAKIIEKERPDALLPTVGGQTGINLAIALDETGVLEKFGVELLGASVAALRLGEDRLLFKEAMEEIGLKVPKSGYAGTLDEARAIALEIGVPIIVRPSFTLGGEGGGVVYNRDELDEIVAVALDASPARPRPARAVGPRLEGVRARGHARPRGQRHRRLFGRELRRHGRAHRRLDHRARRSRRSPTANTRRCATTPSR